MAKWVKKENPYKTTGFGLILTHRVFWVPSFDTPGEKPGNPCTENSGFPGFFPGVFSKKKSKNGREKMVGRDRFLEVWKIWTFFFWVR